MRIRVLLGSNDHGFSLAGNFYEMIRTKPVMDRINVFLEIRSFCDPAL